MQHQVFMSYSRKDADVMRRICGDMRAAGLTVWTDESLIPGTESWKNAIENAIQNAGSVVVILSPDSKQSIWVERELDYARACGLPIIPVLVRGDKEVSAVPFELINAQRVDLRWDYAGNMPRLIAAVQELLGQPGAEVPFSPAPHHDSYSLPNSEKLDSFNFLDHVRLLGWLLLDPRQYLAYRQTHGMLTIRQTGAWLVSDIAWTAFLLPLLGFVLGTVTIPGTAVDSSTSVLLIVAGLLFIGGWFLTAWIGSHEGQIASVVLLIVVTVMATLIFVIAAGIAGVLFVAGGGLTGLASLLTTAVAIGTAAGLAFHFANSTVGALAGLVIAGLIVTVLSGLSVGIEIATSGIAMAALAFGVGGAVDINLRTGRRSLLGLVMLLIIPVNMAVMVWMYFLGGWQILQ